MKRLILPLALALIISCNNKKKSDAEKQTTSTTTPEKETTTVSSENDGSIIGKWTPVEIDIANMEESEKEKVLNKATIEFTEDSKYISISENNNETGTYDYNIDAKNLRTFSPNGDTERLSVTWEKDLLKMTNKEGVVTFKRVNQ
jgi:hypothetical protein